MNHGIKSRRLCKDLHHCASFRLQEVRIRFVAIISGRLWPIPSPLYAWWSKDFPDPREYVSMIEFYLRLFGKTDNQAAPPGPSRALPRSH